MWRALVDLLLAAAMYGVAWRLRFGADLPAFLPYAWRSLPLVVGCQLIGVWLSGSYRGLGVFDRVRRFLLGSVAGSAAGAVLALLVFGRTGLSFSAMTAGIALFICSGAFWRGIEGVWLLNRRRIQPAWPVPPGMVAIGAPRTLTLGFADLYKYRALVRGLVARDLKVKYRGSVLGFAWSLANPLVMVAVYTVAFTYFLQIHEPRFVLHLLLGLLAWSFFANSALMATGAVVDSGGLIKSVAFPRAILPLSTVLFNLSQYLLTMVVFLPVMFAFYRVWPTPAMIAFPVFLTLQLAFTVGVACALAALTALYRDVRHLTEIALSVLFWLTPIVYSLDQLPASARFVVGLSPLAPFITAYHRMFYFQTWPEPSLWTIAALYATSMLVVGLTLFFSLEDRFGEQV